MNIITINFVQCDPMPAKGYHLFWRAVGSGDPYTDGGNFFTTPIVFSDDTNPDGTEYEGILVSEYSHKSCNEMPWSTIVSESSGQSIGSVPDNITQCLMGLINPFTGTLNVLVNHSSGIISISGIINCLGACPCTLNTGAVVGRTTPSSPCNPCEDANSLFGANWVFGQTGYLVYVGPPVEIGCDGMEVNINFDDPCFLPPV